VCLSSILQFASKGVSLPNLVARLVKVFTPHE
jgi:hypothetical protein